jgi:glycerol-3-phosphate acyltransferase PlsY
VPELVIKLLASYLLGSVNGSLVVGRLRGGVDIRRQGSGNAGSANALRTQGKVFAFWVLLIDTAKGWLAIHVIGHLHLPQTISDPHLAPMGMSWIAVGCALAVILGHIYPVWFGFRGGKGVATLLGAVLGLHAAALAPMLLTWLATLVLTGFVALASILATGALCVAFLLTGAPPLQIFGSLCLLLIIFTHRSNLSRLRAGNEPRTGSRWRGRRASK